VKSKHVYFLFKKRLCRNYKYSLIYNIKFEHRISQPETEYLLKYRTASPARMFDFPQSNPKGKTGLAGLGRIATLEERRILN
jgi:hypothetical protein